MLDSWSTDADIEPARPRRVAGMHGRRARKKESSAVSPVGGNTANSRTNRDCTCSRAGRTVAVEAMYFADGLARLEGRGQ